ncbi:unnamed protein product, partial [Gulo gulo]
MYVVQSGLTAEKERKAHLLNTCAPPVSSPFPFQQRPLLTGVWESSSPASHQAPPRPTMLVPNRKGTRQHRVFTPAVYI